MIIETLILSIFTAIIGGTVGYLYGKNHAESLYKDVCGWNISVWKGMFEDKIFICAKRDNKEITLILDNNDVTFNMFSKRWQILVKDGK